MMNRVSEDSLLPDHDLSLEEYDAHLDQCDTAEKKWNAACAQLKHRWREAPAPILPFWRKKMVAFV